MDIIDTHSHPQFPQYDVDREEVIRRALDAGVGMICVGTDEATSRRAIELARQYEGVWASVGIHPNDADQDSEGFRKVRDLVDHPKVVAVGEIGLDYYRTTDHVAQENQRELLRKFLTIEKPFIIHCRDSAQRVEGQASAHEDMLSIIGSMNRERSESGTGSSTRGVIHSFTGTLDQALHYIELGYHIGLNGIVTFARQYDEVVKGIPLERVLLETDAPYLTPVPYRGQRNESAYIHEVASTVAQLRGITKEEVMKVTTLNARTLFNI
jgi:TatD DNase family protein